MNQSVLIVLLPTFFSFFAQFSLAGSFSCEGMFSDQPVLVEKQILTKPIQVGIPQTADSALDWIRQSLHTNVTEKNSLNERFSAIKNLPIAYLIAAPGHNILRDQAQIDSLKNYIQNNDQGNFEKDKILLNIITDSSGKITSVDVWNAHHRLIAYNKLNYKTIGELKIKNLEILVNGTTAGGNQWRHYVPAYGLSPVDLSKYRRAPGGFGIQPNTIEVPGNLSNFQIGSRTTLNDLTFSPATKGRKVAVFFGTFDPIHEGHIATANSIAKQFNLDEVVLVHNVNPLHKPNAVSSSHRFEMVKLRIQSESNLNLYQGDSDFVIREFGKDLFLDQLKQIYASKEIFEILGDDSYQKLLNLNQLNAEGNRQYIVMPRSANSHIQIPDHLKNVISEAAYIEGLSSTLVREKIRNGEEPNSKELFPELFEYIKKFKLYFIPEDKPKAS